MASKEEGGGTSVPLMFTGIQILEPRIFDYIPRGVFSHTTTDVYPQAMAQGERIAVHVASGNESWHELSTLQRYLDISLQLLAETGQTITAGDGCEISREAECEPGNTLGQRDEWKQARASGAPCSRTTSEYQRAK